MTAPLYLLLLGDFSRDQDRLRLFFSSPEDHPLAEPLFERLRRVVGGVFLVSPSLSVVTSFFGVRDRELFRYGSGDFVRVRERDFLDRLDVDRLRDFDLE